MKTKLFRPIGLFLVSVMLLTTVTNCEKEILGKKNTVCTPTFNLNKFEENVNTAFGNSVMGYAYVITHKGSAVRSAAVGKAQNGADGNINMSLNLEMQVASISKFITSLTAMVLCRDKGKSFHTKIGPYLPSDWTRGPGIDDVTIAQLITQTAGLNVVGTQGFNATRFDSLRAYVAAGATGPKTRRYTNTHCGLLRVILPRLWDKYRPNVGTGGYDADFCADVYKKCVQQLILDKVNITADCMPSNGNQILAYTGQNDNGSGNGSATDFTLVSGGMGWNLTCAEVAKIWAYAWYSDLFIDATDKTWAQNNRAGLWNTVMGGKYGDYYCKLGGWSFTSGSPSKDMNSCVMLFPNDYQITIFTNSPVPGGNGLNGLASKAYEDAHVCN